MFTYNNETYLGDKERRLIEQNKHLPVSTVIHQYKRGEVYLLSGTAAVFGLVLIGNFLPLWWITTTSLLAFVIAHAYLAWEKS